MPKGPHEQSDLILVKELIFAPRGLELQRFTHAETVVGRTPDYRVFLSGNLVAFAEVKSPRDDWLDIQLDAAPSGQIVGGLRNDPIFNRIARHIEKASTQFDAVNNGRLIPNILVFVNHDRASNLSDLRETLTGQFYAESGERFPTMTNISEGRIYLPKQRIDLYAWVDVHNDRVQGYLFNETAIPNHVQSLCELLNLDSAKIKH